MPGHKRLRRLLGGSGDSNITVAAPTKPAQHISLAYAAERPTSLIVGRTAASQPLESWEPDRSFTHQPHPISETTDDLILLQTINSSQLDRGEISTRLRKFISNTTEGEEAQTRRITAYVLRLMVELYSPISTRALSNMLFLPMKQTRRALGNLHSLLAVPEDETSPIKWRHLSLYDRFHESSYSFSTISNGTALQSCLMVMTNTLRTDLCCLHVPGALASEVKRPLLDQCLPEHAQYACHYWVNHLGKSSLSHEIEPSMEFLKTSLLHWLEAVSLMGNMGKAREQLKNLKLSPYSFPREPIGSEGTINEALEFVSTFGQIIETAPLQVYSCALAFAPMGMVRKQAENHMTGRIRCLSKVGRNEPLRLDSIEIGGNWHMPLQTSERHLSEVEVAAFSPNGKLAASGSNDAIWLWDLATGGGAQWEIPQTHEDDRHSAGIVQFSPNGKLVASASDDSMVRLWDPITGTLQWTLSGHQSDITAIAFSPDGMVLASGSHDNTVRLWDPIAGTLLQTLSGHLKQITAVVFSPDGKLLASASDDKTVKIWELSPLALLQTLADSTRSIFGAPVVFSPNGKLVGCGSFSKLIFWDPVTGVRQGTLNSCAISMSAATFSPNEKMVATASGAVAFSPDGTLVATVGAFASITDIETEKDKSLVHVLYGSGAAKEAKYYRRVIAISGLAEGHRVHTLEGHTDTITSIAISSQGLLASASADSTIRLWDPVAGEQLQTLEGRRGSVGVVAFSPDGKLVASATRVWDCATGALLQILESTSTWVSPPAIVFSPDSSILASVSSAPSIDLLDTANRTRLGKLDGHQNSVTAVAFSPDGKLLASASSDNTVRLWDPANMILLQTLRGHQNFVTTVAFSPDNKLVASGSGDRMVKLWDPVTGNLLRTLEGHYNFVTAVVISPVGNLVASASADSTIRLWDPATGITLQTLMGHSVPVNDVAFSPDGKLVASTSSDGTIRLWDPVTGELQETIKADVTVRKLSFSSDGNCLDTDRGQLSIRPFHPGVISPQSNSEDGREIFVGESWVTRGGKNFLCLPPEYRMKCAAARDRLLVMGHESGSVLILEFDTS